MHKFFLIVSLLVNSMTSMLFAQNNNTATTNHIPALDFQFEIKDNTVTIIRYNGTAPVVVIPATYKGMPVTNIGENVFYKRTHLTNITIPKSVTNIEEYAFVNCVNLTNIIVSEGNPNYSSVKGVLYNKEKTKVIADPTEKTNH